MTPGLDDIRAARERIRQYVRATPVVESEWLSRRTGARVSLKLDNLQVTGSFKIRGAFNALLQLAPRTSIVAASAGNHGRAMACAAEKLGFEAMVFTPRDAPHAKVDAIRSHGARLDTDSADYDEAERRALAFAAAHNATFISPYNHPHVIAGAGTVALELLDEAPDVDTIVVPVGGGGLISGVALAIRGSGTRVRIVGVEPEASPAFTESLKQGRPARVTVLPTIADGLSGNLDPDTLTFPLVRDLVDEMVTVSEDELRMAIRELAGSDHVVAEGAGAAATAAIMTGKVRRAGRTVALVSGGNIDVARLAEELTAP